MCAVSPYSESERREKNEKKKNKIKLAYEVFSLFSSPQTIRQDTSEKLGGVVE